MILLHNTIETLYLPYDVLSLFTPSALWDENRRPNRQFHVIVSGSSALQLNQYLCFGGSEGIPLETVFSSSPAEWPRFA